MTSPRSRKPRARRKAAGAGGRPGAPAFPYRRILVPVEGTAVDETILAHVVPLAVACGADLILLHVADGWAARWYGPEADSREVVEDRAYLDALSGRLARDGLAVESHLAFGDPAAEIIRLAGERSCDLIAMSTHGHRFLADLVFGSTVSRVRHTVEIPVLLLKAPRGTGKP